jgi:hypothetical protein
MPSIIGELVDINAANEELCPSIAPMGKKLDQRVGGR